MKCLYQVIDIIAFMTDLLSKKFESLNVMEYKTSHIVVANDMPRLIYVVEIVSRFMSNPNKHPLQPPIIFWQFMSEGRKSSIDCFKESDWADDRKSTTGFVFCIGEISSQNLFLHWGGVLEINYEKSRRKTLHFSRFLFKCIFIVFQDELFIIPTLLSL